MKKTNDKVKRYYNWKRPEEKDKYGWKMAKFGQKMVKFGQEMEMQGRENENEEEKMKKRKYKKDKKMYILRKDYNHELNKNPTFYDRYGYIMKILEIDWNTFL